ncbi:MAG: MBL fold metallo-hydrolase [Candidatus Kerfeldbacteria bacterium]|nr:MBL fold metallo-hydrolase [Candidatus Kerfeldbacteria bacterium]
MPSAVPLNVAFVVNDRFLHPGDSLQANVNQTEVLCLPTAAPWGTALQFLELAERLRPRIAIPIHDGSMKGFYLERIYELMFAPRLKAAGIEFRPLKPDEPLELG